MMGWKQIFPYTKMSEDFEDSIRKKLNEADIPFDQGAWTKMESLLDAGDKNRPVAWWWWLFLLPLFGGFGWWLLQPPPAKHKAPVTAVAPQKAAEQLPDGMADPEKKAVTPSKEHVPHGTTSSENKLTNGTAQPSDHLLPEKKTGIDKPTNEGAIIHEQSITTPAQGLFIAGNDGQLHSNDLNFLKIKNIDNAYAYTKISNAPEIPVDTSLQQEQVKKIQRRKINSKGLYFGVTFGPDLNVAPSFNYGNIGFNIGVLANYYFNQHWFVTTGAVYSKKIYGATPNDYTPPGNWTPSADLTKIKANCDVLDIPVNINYTFLQVNNNTLSATLGVSNYFMLKEKYQYLYKSSPTRERTVENEYRHYLAILNVGALYQHPAGKRLIIGVQPYAKIPLHGVGLGQVKLYSAGISFQVNLLGKKR